MSERMQNSHAGEGWRCDGQVALLGEAVMWVEKADGEWRYRDFCYLLCLSVC